MKLSVAVVFPYIFQYFRCMERGLFGYPGNCVMRGLDPAHLLLVREMAGSSPGHDDVKELPVNQSSIEYLERLVGFATVSRDSNLELIDFVQSEAEAAGATCRIVASEDGRKANLLATLGPAERPGILLSGHTDVVPVEGQAWTSDPFRLRRQDGRLYGRGTAD